MAAARLKDIAQATGFSVNTVSLALRGSPRISPATQEQVRAIAEQLNYVPNKVARSLVSQETRSIGLLLTDLTNPILTAVAQGVESALNRQGYATFIATSNNRLDEERRMIALLREQRADGMLVFPCSHRDLDHLYALRDDDYPVVLLVNDPLSRVDSVSMNEYEGARKAARYLLDIGHRRIALIDGGTFLGNTEKYEGYAAALKEAGVEADEALRVDPKGHSASAGYWAMHDLAARDANATAVLASTDSLAIGVVRYCAKAGIDVPGDISVMGFDDTEFSEFAQTPLSSVRYEASSVSHTAVERLLELTRAKDGLAPPRTQLFEPQIIVRDSTAKPKSP